MDGVRPAKRACLARTIDKPVVRDHLRFLSGTLCIPPGGGKSLLVQRLKYMFPDRPTLNFNFDMFGDDVEQALVERCRVYAAALDLALVQKTSHGALRELINKAQRSTRENVVVLIDGCDEPIHRNRAVADTVRRFLQVLEECATQVHFALAVGITDVALPAHPRLLVNRSGDRRLATLCGFSRAEIANTLDVGSDNQMAQIETWCGGYRPSEHSALGNCHPQAVLRYLAEGRPPDRVRTKTPDLDADELYGFWEAHATGSLALPHARWRELIQFGLLSPRGSHLVVPNQRAYLILLQMVTPGVRKPGQLVARVVDQLHNGNVTAFKELLRTLHWAVPRGSRDRQRYQHTLLHLIGCYLPNSRLIEGELRVEWDNAIAICTAHVQAGATHEKIAAISADLQRRSLARLQEFIDSILRKNLPARDESIVRMALAFLPDWQVRLRSFGGGFNWVLANGTTKYAVRFQREGSASGALQTLTTKVGSQAVLCSAMARTPDGYEWATASPSV